MATNQAASPPVEPKDRRPAWLPVELPAGPIAPGAPYPRAGCGPFGSTVTPPPPVVAQPPVVQPASYPDPKNYEWVHRHGDPLPPTAEPGVLETLVGARGHSALDEAVGAVHAIDRLLSDAKAIDDAARAERSRPSQWADRLMATLPGFGRSRPAASPVTIDLTARRSVYFDRACLIAKLLKVEPPSLIDPRFLSPDAAKAELALVEASISGLDRKAADVDGYGRLGIQPDLTIPEIDEQIIGLAERREASGPRPRTHLTPSLPQAVVAPTRRVFPQDEVVNSLNHFHRRRRELAAQVKSLEAAELAKAKAEADRVKATASRVKQAVEAAGGVELVASSIVAAMALSEPQQAVNPGLAAIEQELAHLRAAGVESGPSIDSARARRSELTAAAEASARDRASARRARAASLLTDSLAGNALSVEMLRTLAEASANAFPAGFSASL